ncbi:MAG: right-handed parallel beta-helix repeat-containing protein [Lentisphaeria bacterium]|nr:right-handed parallel beta-helix repeat-containing protein [Lentisphaeria bacterium]
MARSVVVGCLCCALAVCAGPGRGAEHVVDRNHPAAADTNPGTEAAPLQTIAAAAERARAGDTVRVKAGVYREAVALRHSGTAESPIRFVADPAGSVVVSGAELLSEWAPLPGETPIYSHAWPHRFAINWKDGKPIEHHPEYHPRWGRAEQVVVDGRLLVIAENLDELRSAWKDRGEVSDAVRGTVGQEGVPDVLAPATWPGMFAVDTDAKRLYLWLADGSSPSGRVVEAAARGQLFGANQWQVKEGLEHIHVRGFTFRYGASFPQRGILTLHGRSNLVEDCLVDAASGGGAHVCGAMRGCTIRRCGHVGGGAVGNGFVNEQVLVQDNCWKPIRRGWDAGGAKSARAHGGLVRQCVYRRNGGPGLWFDIDVADVTVSESVFMDNEMSGLFVEISRDFVIRHNLFLRNCVGSVRCGDWHDWGSAGILLAESLDCRVEYNTCVGNKDGIAIREQGPRPLDTPDRGRIPYHNDGHRIHHNLCVGNRGYQMALWYDNAFFGMHPSEARRYEGKPPPYEEWVKTVDRELYDPRKANLEIDYNRVYAGPGARLYLFGCPWRERHRVFDDVAGFRAETGFGSHDIVAEVPFRNASADDYRFPEGQIGAGWASPPGEVDAWIRSLWPVWQLE